ncbi:hypothetical protein CCHR01_07567 [Colletotrichum chrysophilum]|uniref:Uncharacterized protein n=1 Tax=Colletotrichum chrysophilum TaxID=1836956 RepID=A0AAD9ALR2_9PEZI|nr:hypothetical protein CCHR01_07567 [Colletotrichum chrysophilum]
MHSSISSSTWHRRPSASWTSRFTSP